MPTYLYHAKSNEFYLHTAQLAKRTDMQVVEADTLEQAKARVAAIHATANELAAQASALATKTPAEKAADKKAAAKAEAAKAETETAAKPEAAANLFDQE
jgi:hypothetical protein